MANMSESPSDPVSIIEKPSFLLVELNRPEVLNSLNLQMVRLIGKALDAAESSSSVRHVVFSGKGARGFCAGGDIRLIADAVSNGSPDEAMEFFEEEYRLDLRIHRFPKPVIVLADGVTMGGGLGISAGADIVIATERTRMAMPETRIGFFPDVGATGWLFSRCPQGYPEFLALTGYEAKGAECVRVGLATHLAYPDKIGGILSMIEHHAAGLPEGREDFTVAVSALLRPLVTSHAPAREEMDAWVRKYFAGRHSVPEVLGDLRHCSLEQELCRGVSERLSDRSPLSVVWTLALLRYNQGRDLAAVFGTDLKAARCLIEGHDFREGVRARLIDRDNRPQWSPKTFEEAASLFDPSDVFR